MPGSNSIEGISSGFNITEIVDKTIQYERIPVTYLEQDKEFKTQQVAAYQAVLAKFLAVKAQISILERESSYNKANIVVSDSSILTASATGRVTEGMYKLRVTSLAANHQLASQGFNDATSEIFGTGTIKLSLGEDSLTTISIEPGNNSLIGIKDAINEAKIGVTASIIDDGSSSHPYRLLLSGDETGVKNKINFEISLIGGDTIDLENTSFDAPEIVSVSDNTTSQVSLATSASYSGSVNKTYTFTVKGFGTQTIGTDNITIDWTDGTNAGSILVTQADTAVELFGDGADGLAMAFSGGTLEAGDTFEVSTFAPLLQKASDAQVSIGSDVGGSGSPIVIKSSSNTFENIVPGLSLNVLKVNNPGESVTLNTSVDSSAIKSMISDFIEKYNDVMTFIDDQFTYDTETTESGVLFADFQLQIMQSSFRMATTYVVKGLKSGLSSLSSIGIRSGADGQLKIADSAALTKAIKNNLDDVIRLFVDSGSSSNSYIDFISATDKTVPGDNYSVDITQAATRGYYEGAQITDPAETPLTLTSENNVLKLLIDGLTSENIVLSEKTYNSGEELAEEIENRINADEVLKGRGIEVEWISGSGEGQLKIINGKYGSNSSVIVDATVERGAAETLGLSTGATVDGLDVQGTINGESATGRGQVLIGDEGNDTTDGLKLKITLTGEQVISGSDGTISIIKGLSSKMDETLENITKIDEGAIARRTSALDSQIEVLAKRISDWDERLAWRREYLYSRYLAMEEALGQFQSQNAYLETQLTGLKNNWFFTNKND